MGVLCMFAGKKVVISQKELDLALNNINQGPQSKGMSQVILLVEKTHKNPDKLFQMFMEERELMLKKLRMAIGKTSLYRLFSFRIDEINAALKTVHPSLAFVERKYVRKNSRIITTYCVHPDCAVSESESFFLLEFKTNVETNERERPDQVQD